MLQIKTFVFNPFGENTYVVYDETKACVVIDPGDCTSSEDEQLFRFVDDNDLNVSMIINTHGHIDHVAGNASVVQRYKAKVAAGVGSRPDFVKVQFQARFFGFPLDKPVALPDMELPEGEIIKIGNSTLEVIETSGHAKGSISLYAELEGLVFTGDALFCRSIGRTDLPGGDYAELCRNIKEKLFHLPDDTTVFCGHGETTTIGEERDFNLYVNG